jgi:hypothetical protein
MAYRRNRDAADRHRCDRRAWDFRGAVRIKALRAHPVLDPEWRARKLAVVQRMGAAAQEVRSDMPRLAAALETIAFGIDGLVTGVRIIAGSVEAIFDVSVPWLRGLLA